MTVGELLHRVGARELAAWAEIFQAEDADAQDRLRQAEKQARRRR